MNLVETVETLTKWIRSCETKEQLITMRSVVEKFISLTMFPDKTSEILEPELWHLHKEIDFKSDLLKPHFQQKINNNA